MLFKRKKEETAKPKNIADILTYQAAERGHKKYLFFKDIVYTYSQAENYVIKYLVCLLFLVFVKGTV